MWHVLGMRPVRHRQMGPVHITPVIHILEPNIMVLRAMHQLAHARSVRGTVMPGMQIMVLGGVMHVPTTTGPKQDTTQKT